MYMYVNGYTNPKDILADFIFAVCFNNDQPNDRWSLIYPEVTSRDEVRGRILEERRATISTTYRDEKVWVKNEKHNALPEPTESTEPTDRIILKLEFPLVRGGQVRVRMKGRVPYYRTNKANPGALEFYVDELNNEIHIHKDLNYVHEKDEFYAVDYEKEGEGSQTWYVAFEYPEFNVEDDDYQNRYFFAWKFGKSVGSDARIMDNKGFQCPYVTTYWHTDNLVDFPIGDWLPIEYFIQFDKKSISFVFCEDPVYLEETVHSFGYIGALDEIPGTLGSDNDGNFGSGGSYLTADSLEDIFIGSTGKVEPAEKETADLKVFKRLFSKTTEQMIEERLILTVNQVTLESEPHQYDDLVHINLESLLYELELQDEYVPLSKGREGFNWYCNFIKIEEDEPEPEPEPEPVVLGSIRVKYLNNIDDTPVRSETIKENQSGTVEVTGEAVDGYKILDPKSVSVIIAEEKEYEVVFKYKLIEEGEEPDIPPAPKDCKTIEALHFRLVPFGLPAGSSIGHNIIINQSDFLNKDFHVSALGYDFNMLVDIQEEKLIGLYILNFRKTNNTYSEKYNLQVLKSVTDDGVEHPFGFEYQELSGNPVMELTTSYKICNHGLTPKVDKSSVRIKYIDEETGMILKADEVLEDVSGTVSVSAKTFDHYQINSPATVDVEITETKQYNVVFKYKVNANAPACSVYKKCSTVAEAEEFMRNCIGADIDYRNEDGTVPSMTSELKLKWLNRLNRAYWKMYTVFPDIREILTAKDKFVKLRLFKESGDGSGFTAGWFTPKYKLECYPEGDMDAGSVYSYCNVDLDESFGGMLVGYNIIDKIEDKDIISAANFQFNIGHSSSNDRDATVVHEMGHALHAINVGRVKFEEYQTWDPDNYGPIKAPQLAQCEADMRKYISNYSTEYFPMEYVSEFFTLLATEVYGPSIEGHGGRTNGGWKIPRLQSYYDELGGQRLDGFKK